MANHASQAYERQDASRFTKLVSPKGDPHHVIARELGAGYWAYRRQWEAAARFEVETPYPTQLDFELNYSCNLKCPMCTWSVETKTTTRQEWLEFALFKRVVDGGVPLGLRSINFNYINEPLMRRDLPDFVAYARQQGLCDLMLNTNGTMLTEPVGRRLIDAGLTRLMVSLDADTEETYNKIRIGANFEQVTRNLLGFLELRNSMGRRLPLVRASFLRMSVNEHELPRFVERWSPHVDFFAIQELINVMPERQESRELTANTRERVAEFRCPQPWQRLIIRYDGSVLPCCTFYGAHLVMGNVHQQSVQAIWRSEAMRQLRALHARGEYYNNPVCRKCAMNSVVDRPQPAAAAG